MKTTEDLKKYIKSNYGISPHSHKNGILQYHSISFKTCKPSNNPVENLVQDLWEVQRTNHSVDYFRLEELEQALDIGGSLLYYILPKRD